MPPIDLPNAAEPVRVIHGDCLDLLPTLPAGCVDCVLTDPPYGVSFDYKGGHDDREAEYGQVLERLFLAETLLKPGGFMAMYQAAKHARRWAEWFPRDWSLIALPKNFVQAGRGRHITPATDYVLWWQVGVGEPAKSWQDGMCRDWFLCNTAKRRDALSRPHPCPRPLDGVRYVVGAFSPPDALILDPFAGSGTTGVAAMKTGRRAILIEKDARYIDVIHRRLDAARTPLLDRLEAH
jgi:DNA modification methylase